LAAGRSHTWLVVSSTVASPLNTDVSGGAPPAASGSCWSPACSACGWIGLHHRTFRSALLAASAIPVWCRASAHGVMVNANSARVARCGDRGSGQLVERGGDDVSVPRCTSPAGADAHLGAQDGEFVGDMFAAAHLHSGASRGAARNRARMAPSIRGSRGILLPTNLLRRQFSLCQAAVNLTLHPIDTLHSPNGKRPQKC
jgi:hypothetical protein